jgi:hypothetical protein
VAGVMQPDLKARIPAKIKTNFWNALVYIHERVSKVGILSKMVAPFFDIFYS